MANTETLTTTRFTPLYKEPCSNGAVRMYVREGAVLVVLETKVVEDAKFALTGGGWALLEGEFEEPKWLEELRNLSEPKQTTTPAKKLTKMMENFEEKQKKKPEKKSKKESEELKEEVSEEEEEEEQKRKPKKESIAVKQVEKKKEEPKKEKKTIVKEKKPEVEESKCEDESEEDEEESEEEKKKQTKKMIKKKFEEVENKVTRTSTLAQKFDAENKKQSERKRTGQIRHNDANQNDFDHQTLEGSDLVASRKKQLQNSNSSQTMSSSNLSDAISDLDGHSIKDKRALFDGSVDSSEAPPTMNRQLTNTRIHAPSIADKVAAFGGRVQKKKKKNKK